MTDEPVTILDTGTRAPDASPKGLTVHHSPALRRQPLPIDALRVTERLEQPAHVVFYSRFAVRVVADAGVIDHPSRHTLWVVGRRTAELCADTFGVTPRTPDDECFEGIRRTLESTAEPRPIVAFGLRGTRRDLGDIASRWSVDFTEIPVYESGPTDPDELREHFEHHQPRWLTVTSSRGVRSVVDALGADRLASLQAAGKLSIAAIGPSTASTLAEFDLDVDVVPEQPDRDGLIEAIATRRHTADDR